MYFETLSTRLHLCILILGSFAGYSPPNLAGNSKFISQPRSVAPWHTISLAGPIDLYIKKGSHAMVSVQGDENLLPLIGTTVQRGTLYIRTKPGACFSTHNPIRIVVTCVEMPNLIAAGSGSVKGKGNFSTKKVHIHISGSGACNLAFGNLTQLTVIASGSGTLKLVGQVKDFTLRHSGSGGCWVDGLKAQTMRCRLSGSGDCTLTPAPQMDIKAVGSGRCYMKTHNQGTILEKGSNLPKPAPPDP